MIGLKFKNIAFHYDDKGERFTVITEKQEHLTFTNASEARERFMNEVERLFRRYLNGCLEKEGFNIHTGRKTNDNSRRRS